MGNVLEDREVYQRREPKDHIEDQGPKKFRQHNLPVPDRRSHERLDRSEFKFLGKGPHGNQRENQNEGEPEENGIEERLLHRVLHRSLIHEGDLKVKVGATDEEKEEQDDVGDRRVEVTRYFAGKEGVEFSHNASRQDVVVPGSEGKMSPT